MTRQSCDSRSSVQNETCARAELSTIEQSQSGNFLKNAAGDSRASFFFQHAPRLHFQSRPPLLDLAPVLAIESEQLASDMPIAVALFPSATADVLAEAQNRLDAINSSGHSTVSEPLGRRPPRARVSAHKRERRLDRKRRRRRRREQIQRGRQLPPSQRGSRSCIDKHRAQAGWSRNLNNARIVEMLADSCDRLQHSRA